MSIKESLEKIKPFYGLMVIILVSSIFFALGRISAEKSSKNGLNIAYSNIGQTSSVVLASTTPFSSKNESITSSIQEKSKIDGPVIGSKSGKKYYFPWCGTVKRIKPENQVKFASIEEAKKAGFTAGGNCKGLN